mgnify:CR=1 FL=1
MRANPLKNMVLSTNMQVKMQVKPPTRRNPDRGAFVVYYSVLPSCFKARLMPVAARPYFRRFVTNAFICGRFWVIPFGGNQFICGHSVRIIRWPSVPACSPQRQRYPYQTHSCRWHQRPGGKRYIRHTKHSPQQKIAQAASHGQKNADSTEIGYTDAIK